VVGALKIGSFTSTSSVGNTGGRFSSGASNFRWAWWQQAWDGWQHAKLVGTGAGSFLLTNLRYRDTYLDQTIEPHNLPLQFLLETGIVGVALLLLALAFLLRPSWRRRGPELALALLMPAYLVHSLVDVDWDFAAVSVPAFLAAGSLAGRLPFRRVSPFATVALAGAAALGFGVLLLPWLGERWANDALFASPARAVQLADRAHSVDPLLVEPLWAKAFAAQTLGEHQRAFDYYVEAVHKQPKNPQTWALAGRYAFANRCYRLAYTYLEKFTELNQKARPSAGGDLYNRALEFVNAGKGACQP
jgi:tetratricopeptide (TPR) repeat protein